MSNSSLRKENEELRAALSASNSKPSASGFRWEDYGRECCQMVGLEEDPRKLLLFIRDNLSYGKAAQTVGNIYRTTPRFATAPQAVPEEATRAYFEAATRTYQVAADAMNNRNPFVFIDEALPAWTLPVDENRT